MDNLSNSEDFLKIVKIVNYATHYKVGNALSPDLGNV